MTTLFASVAGAQTQEEAAPSAEILALEAQSMEQNAALSQGLEEISAVGSSLDEAQAQVNVAETRSQELGGQVRDLEDQIAGHQQSFERSKVRYEERAKAAYKGKDLEGMTAILGSVLEEEGNIGHWRMIGLQGFCLRGARAWTNTRAPGRNSRISCDRYQKRRLLTIVP